MSEKTGEDKNIQKLNKEADKNKKARSVLLL